MTILGAPAKWLAVDWHRNVQRDEILETTNASGFHTRPVWTPMHKLPMYAGCPRMDLSVVESLERRIVCLPSGPRLVS